MARKTILALLCLLVLFLLLAVPPTTTAFSLYAPLSGRVVDPNGAPIEGARVEAHRVHREPGTYMDIGRFQVTPADGAFRFEKLPTGTEWHLSIRRDSWAQDEDPDYRIRTGGTEATAVLHPEKPFVIRVLCAETGRPIPRATVRVGHGRIVLPTKKTGKGEWTVRACSGRIPLNVCVAERGYHGQYFPREPGAADPLVVRLKPAGDIDVPGVAVDEKGRPVSRATVLAVRLPHLGRPRHIHHAFTDAKGRFTLVRLMGRESYRIWAHSFGSGPDLVSEWISVVPKKDLKLRLEMLRTGKISARIVAPPGHPTPVTVYARVHRSDRPDLPQHYGASSFLGKNGAFQATGNPPGVYDVVFRPFPYPEILVSGVKVEAGRTTPLGTIQATPGTEVAVGLKDARGRTENDYRILLLGAEGRLTVVSPLHPPDGSEVRGQIPAGTWRLLATPKREAGALHDLGSVTVNADGPQVFERTVPATGTLIVRVLDASGRPVADHAVTLTAARPPPLERLLAHGLRRDIFNCSDRERAERLWRIRDLRTEPNGKIEFGPLAPGTWVVGAGTARKKVELAAGATVVVNLVASQ